MAYHEELLTSLLLKTGKYAKLQQLISAAIISDSQGVARLIVAQSLASLRGRRRSARLSTSSGVSSGSISELGDVKSDEGILQFGIEMYMRLKMDEEVVDAYLSSGKVCGLFIL
jgi:hypothetical protein